MSDRQNKEHAATKSPKPTLTTAPKQTDIFAGINAWALVGTVGWQAAGPILILGVGGALLDKKLHSSPLLMLLGVTLSFGVSYVLVRGTVRRLQSRIDELVRKGVIKP